MPIMDGIKATRAIRAMEEREKRPHTPIVALTAHALAVSRAECLEAGMDGYVRKPFGLSDLVRSLLDHGLAPTSCEIDSSHEDDASPPQKRHAAAALDPFPLSEIRSLQTPEESDTFLRAFVSNFVEESTKLVEQLEEAVDTGHADGIERTAHAIKSASAQVGAIRLSDAAGELERQARSQLLVHAESLLESILAEHQLACDALREEIQDDSRVDEGGVTLAVVETAETVETHEGEV